MFTTFEGKNVDQTLNMAEGNQLGIKFKQKSDLQLKVF